MPIPQHPNCSGPSGVRTTLGPLQNPARPQQREGLGSRFVEGYQRDIPALWGYFPTLLCSHSHASSSPCSRRARRWPRGDFGAGIWGRGPSATTTAGSSSDSRRSPALASALPAAGSWNSPRCLGHCPLFRRIKLALLLSLSLFQQFLPPLLLGSGKHSCPRLPGATRTGWGGWRRAGGPIPPRSWPPWEWFCMVSGALPWPSGSPRWLLVEEMS